MKTPLKIVAIILLVGVSFYTYNASKTPLPSYQEITPKIDSISIYQQRKATLIPQRSSVLFAPSRGQIKSVSVDVADEVQDQQLLIQVDDQIVIQALKGYESALSRLSSKKESIQAIMNDSKVNKLPPYERLMLEKEVLAIELEEDELKQKIQLSKAKKERTQIKAPFSGLVSELLVTSGDWVKAGSPLVKLVKQDPMYLRLFLPEHLSYLLKIGDEVSLSHPTLPSPIAGKVSIIYPELSQSHGQSKLKIEIVPLSPLPSVLKAGNQLSVKFKLKEKQNVLTLPLHAIQGENGQYFVHVLSGNDVEKRKLVIGLSSQNHVEIVSGLSQDDVVLAR